MPEPKKTAKSTEPLSPENVQPSIPTTPTTSTVLQAAIDRQEQELLDLDAEMDRRADDFAERAAAIVRSGLSRAYAKAHAKIITIDLPFFASPPRSTSPNSLPESSIEERTIEC